MFSELLNQDFRNNLKLYICKQFIVVAIDTNWRYGDNIGSILNNETITLFKYIYRIKQLL